MITTFTGAPTQPALVGVITYVAVIGEPVVFTKVPVIVNAFDSGTDAPAAEEKDEKLYNLADLRIIQKDDEGFVKNIVGLFISNVPKNAAELVTAADNGDWEKVYFIAHKMKSSIELVNIESIRADVKRVELNAKTKTNLEEIPEKVAYINSIVEKAAAQMKYEFDL